MTGDDFNVIVDAFTNQRDPPRQLLRKYEDFESGFGIMVNRRARERFISDMKRAARTQYFWKTAAMAVNARTLTVTDFLEATHEPEDPEDAFPMPASLEVSVYFLCSYYLTEIFIVLILR